MRLVDLAFVLAAGVLGACGDASSSDASDVRRRATIVIPVEGMACESCAERIEKTLRSLDGVVEAKVDFGAEHARIAYDAERVTSVQIATAIGKLGFTVGVAKEAR